MSKLNPADVDEFKEVKQRLRQAEKKTSVGRRLALAVAIVAVFQLGIAGGIFISSRKGTGRPEVLPEREKVMTRAVPLQIKPASVEYSQPPADAVQVKPAVTTVPPTAPPVKKQVARKVQTRKPSTKAQELAAKKKRARAYLSAQYRYPAAPLSIDVAGGDIGRAYAAGMRSIIERHKEHPVNAAGDFLEGRCLIVCIIKRDGSLRHAEVIRTSGNADLDAAALRSVRKAGNFPRVPDAIPGEELSFDVPLTFRAYGQ